MYEVIKKIPLYGITLYRQTELTPNIYYYFTHDRKVYKGSTGTSNTNQAELKAEEKYWEVKEGRGKSRRTRFEAVVKDFLSYKENRVSPKTFEEYKRQSKFLIEKFKGKDISAVSKRDFYRYETWRRNYYDTHKMVYRRNGKRIKTHFHNPGNTSINRELGLLVSILRFTQREMGLLQHKVVPSWTKLPENSREDTLSRSEYEKLKRYWLGRDRYKWILFLSFRIQVFGILQKLIT